MTFNGTVSGLRRYRIHCPEGKTEKTVAQGDDIDYKEDSYVVVTNLNPGSEYSLAVTAYGCKNSSKTTAYFQAKTKPFTLGSFEVISVRIL